VTPPARLDAAITLLAAIEAAPRAPADAIAQDFFRQRRFIGSADRRWIADLVWTVLRQRLRLDWHIAQAPHPVTARAVAIAALRLIEGAAADAVAGLFSGARYGPAPLDADERRLNASLHPPLAAAAMDRATALNAPQFLLDSLRLRFGDRLAAEMAAFDQPAPLDLRVNLLKADRETARTALAAEGFEATPTPLSPWGLRLAGRAPITGTRAFREGLVEIQDEGSQLIAWLADARPGLRVLDFCAGAGGKALAMAALMDNRGQLVAADVSVPRLEAAVRRLRRAGVHNVERRAMAPGEKWLKRARGAFDRVLVDAPCTGTGTWRRNPDARLTLRPADLSELLTKQRDILLSAARLVKSGGKLVYATCSVLPEENSAQVEWLLTQSSEFRVLPLAEVWPDGTPPCAGPYLALSPATHGTDGFFAAVLQRTEPRP
jgi:16S rRNA (cytosine967-C5)-methyltransferase